jgi:N-acyl-D-amino-acid deacylase
MTIRKTKRNPHSIFKQMLPIPNYDVLIQNGKIIDGSGNPWYYGDLAIRGKRIAAITPPRRIAPEAIREIVNAQGMVVCPGFIDIQSHSIAPLMVDGRSVSKITQGVTTEIMGEGWTPAPFGGKITAPLLTLFAEPDPAWAERIKTWDHFRDWLDTMVSQGVSPNIGSFLGGWTLRQYAMGMEVGPPSTEELSLMQRLTAEAMEAGAFGVARALIYPPDSFAKTEELVAISQVVSRYSGIYIAHMRSEANGIEAALEETLEIGRRAGLPIEIYHLKAAGRHNWHKMPAIIAAIQQARDNGQDVSAAMYPYQAGGSTLVSALPPWSNAGGKLFANLRAAEMRASIKAELLHPSEGWEAVADLSGPEGVIPLDYRNPENKSLSGKSMLEIAELRDQEWPDALIDLLLSEESYWAKEDASKMVFTYFVTISEENIRLQLQQPWVKISTDAGGYDPIWGKEWAPVHPRSYGSYARILGKYVREEKILTLEEAIRKMSSAVAQRLNIRDRGLLREGMKADVVIFDPDTVADRATYADPHQLSVGVRDVWVNGQCVLKDGLHTNATPGEIVTPG